MVNLIYRKPQIKTYILVLSSFAKDYCRFRLGEIAYKDPVVDDVLFSEVRIAPR